MQYNYYFNQKPLTCQLRYHFYIDDLVLKHQCASAFTTCVDYLTKALAILGAYFII